jgi:quinol monooxygenase YgiN
MRRRFSLALASSALLVACAAAQTTGKRLYVVTHVDIIGTGTNLPNGIALMREFAADSQKDPGAIRVEVLQQDSRKNHFTIVEEWQSRKAFEVHWAAEHSKRFREKIEPMLGSPFDERLNEPIQ